MPHGALNTRKHFSHSLALAGLLLAIWLTGCASNRPVRYFQDEDNQETIKRIAKKHETGLTQRWIATAYRKRSSEIKPRKVSEDQREILDVYGQPDYIRRSFTSQFNERVHEWVYLDKDALMQFIGGDVVHVQPVTGLEKTLIFRGYPNSYYQTRQEGSPLRQVFIYRNWYGNVLHVYTFSNGAIISQDE